MYEEGIGTIYADAVNSFTAYTDCQIILEIATNVTAAAVNDGVSFATAGMDYDKYEWHQIPMTILPVENGSILSTNNLDELTLDVTNGGTARYFRMRTQLNYYDPIRFRIRRTSHYEGDADAVGLIAIDNIIASYPPMTIRLERYGEDYDASLVGAEVLGCLGDFNVPFQAVGQNGVQAKIKIAWVANNVNEEQKIIVNNPKFHYRWRYLNQFVPEWSTLDFSPSTPSYLEDSSATQLVTTVDHTLNQGVGDLEYYFTADLDAQYYSVRDYANDTFVGFGFGWTEQIFAVTNRATYTVEDRIPSGGTNYFVRIREGESNMEWVQLVGSLTITNELAGSNEVYRLETPDKTVPRMTLVGDHSWRYHYQIPTNGVGGKLSFYLVTKEHYTNETDATTWLVRTNNLYTAEETVTAIPYTATLDPGNPNEISVILDESSTHLKIEYNDEQRAFSLSHAAYQTFNQWTDAIKNFHGNVMSTNGEDVVSNSGVSEKKGRSDAPFDRSWELCPEQNDYWTEKFTKPIILNSAADPYPTNKWAAIGPTPNGWTAHNFFFVLGTRDAVSQLEEQDLAVALDGNGQGSVGLENFPASALPLGLDSVSFTARIAQPSLFEDFATYSDGRSSQNYAISAKVTMSRMKETDTVKPSDMSPLYPSVSLVGYHRGEGKNGGCYEFRMTRITNEGLELAFYKWEPAKSGSGMTPTLLKAVPYSSTTSGYPLVPRTDAEARDDWRSSAYFLVYTLGGKVKLEGHLSSSHAAAGPGIASTDTGLSASSISYVDDNPGKLALGGSYGVGSTDCRAGFNSIKIHDVLNAPTADTTTAGDATINWSGSLVGHDRLDNDWNYYSSRWEVDSLSSSPNGGITAVVPSNQVIQVWLSDASANGGTWYPSGYERVVDSFTTNKFEVSPRLPGSWKVMLKTGEEEDTGVIVDDIEITPWEGVERWGRSGSAYDHQNGWIYTKSWIDAVANITHNGKRFYLPNDCVKSAGTNGYAFVFNRAGTYKVTPTADMIVDRLLLVGGGGAGGAAMGGGGGGGGVLDYKWSDSPAVIPAGRTITLVVGAGGTVQIPRGTGSNATSQPAGNNGGNTSVRDIPVKGNLEVKGGGGGGGWGQGARSLATGGGGAHSNNGAAGTSGQGYAGGKSGDGTGGGGGGAGSKGADGEYAPNTSGNTGKGGHGGDGIMSDITGEIAYYGGGGGGGCGWQPTQTPGEGGAGGGGDGAKYRVAYGAGAGVDGLGGGGGGGTYMGVNNTEVANKQGQGARGGCGAVIMRVRTSSRVCLLQPSRGQDGYPMGVRSPYINEGMSLFSYSYQNADSNCVMLVQIATNMTPSELTSDVPRLTESLATEGSKQIWTTIDRHVFTNASELASGTRTTFISLREHWVDDMFEGHIYTNVCGLIRVIVDPAVVSTMANTFEKTPATGAIVKDIAAREAMIDYGKITITKAYCYNEPALNIRSWFGFNVHTEGWNGSGGAGPYAFLADWPDGLSIALNFSAKPTDNTGTDAHGIGLADSDPTEVTKYAQQNPFIQCAALTNGIGTVSFRARLFDTTKTSAVVTLYGSDDPSADQPNSESQYWKPITNFVVQSPTYHAFEWKYQGSTSPYKAIRLEAAGARWGRYPEGQAKGWEWNDLKDASKFGTAVVEQPINRVFIDEVSVSELIVPRLKFLDVRPFREHLGTEAICRIMDINSPNQQPLIAESWGIQCRVEPQQMADELDTGSIRVWMEVYRGEIPWGYEQWKDLPKYKKVGGQDVQQRFTSELQRVSDSELVYRSYSTFPESIMPPEDTANTVYQYIVRAKYRDKSGRETDLEAMLEPEDWTVPEWYRGSEVGAGNDLGLSSQFSAYTILDAISPRRAWINEVNNCDADNTKGLYQFIEFAVPERADLKGWYVQYTAYNLKTGNLLAFGIDDGVRNLTSKIGTRHGVDSTNHYTFVSVCAPTARGNVASDGYWKSVTQPSLTNGRFSYYQPYGIQLIRPSGIIEHEIVVQGTNTSMGTFYEYEESGTNLLARLLKADSKGQWIYAGEDKHDEKTTLGVFRSHGEDTGCWTNYMWDTSTEINKLKDGTLQEIPFGYFLEPFGTNVWIYSTILSPQYMKQFFGDRDMGANAVIVVPKDTHTNIVLQITNWYQIGTCTINGNPVDDAHGKTGKYTLDLGSVSNTLTVIVGTERDDRLKDEWGLTDQNSYSPAVMDWLFNEYSKYGPEDLSKALYKDLSKTKSEELTLTEMYWLNIPPVHKDNLGGSNIWFVAGMGSLIANEEPDVEPRVTVRPDGTIRSNVYMTVTMMITNKATDVAWPPDRLNGHVYDGRGSSDLTSEEQSAWTSAVFSIVGALQKSDVSDRYLPLQQYTFKPGSFGAADETHPFQTRVEVVDPHSPNSMGNYYGWGMFPDTPVWFRWVIKPHPEESRISTVPLTPNWSPSSGTP